MGRIDGYRTAGVVVTRKHALAFLTFLTTLATWLGLGATIGVACGSASALFLALLDLATETRRHHEVLLYFLPIAGLVIGAVYERFGASVKGGNNLVLDTIHDGGPEIPLRLAPMVLVGTVLTHLFGGSAGREGTAVQIGAALADALSHRLRLSPGTRRQLLAAGVAGGFGSVFGTPVAGAVFGLEFIVLGRIEYDALVPALVSAIVGDMVTRAWGIQHTHYPAAPTLALTPLLLAKWICFALVVALVTTAFIELTHGVKKLGERYLPRLPLRMLVGGIALLLMWKASGTDDYLGLGVPMIVRSFTDVDLPTYAFAAKLVFTAVTLGAGFLGGEVTPLFFVGAALGSTLSHPLGIPIELGASVGLAAVFASASNTPIALSLMAVELVGGGALPHAAIVCVLAYLLTGHRSIYPSQRVLRRKSGGSLFETAIPLHELPRHELVPPDPPSADVARGLGETIAQETSPRASNRDDPPTFDSASRAPDGPVSSRRR